MKGLLKPVVTLRKNGLQEQTKGGTRESSQGDSKLSRPLVSLSSVVLSGPWVFSSTTPVAKETKEKPLSNLVLQFYGHRRRVASGISRRNKSRDRGHLPWPTLRLCLSSLRVSDPWVSGPGMDQGSP